MFYYLLLNKTGCPSTYRLNNGVLEIFDTNKWEWDKSIFDYIEDVIGCGLTLVETKGSNNG